VDEEMFEVVAKLNGEVSQLSRRVDDLRIDFNKRLDDLKSDFSKRLDDLRSDFNEFRHESNNRFYWILGTLISMWVTVIITTLLS